MGKGATQVGKMSREKGKRYEREIAGILREYGYDARRTAQNCGKSGDAADVVGLDGIHIECKHQEQIKIYDWISQAKRDSAGTGKIPAVFFRKNNCENLVCLRLEDFITLYREYTGGAENG